MDKFVEYRGMRVVEGWPEKIGAAQLKTTYVIDGESILRVRYGAEKGWPRGPRRRCHDCAVISGEFHVPGCDMERCPRCHGQVITCGCSFDEGELPDPME